jgi:plastocyanin
MRIQWRSPLIGVALNFLISVALPLPAQDLLDVTAEIRNTTSIKANASTMRSGPPAALWLTPVHATASTSFLPARPYTLLQKNKQFSPHLLIVPVGGVVHFPNADPFFHNVFSLFDGRRFDLGLYEAGSTRDVTFGREGVSYIFCNIHPEMSAVVIALTTPFYGVEGKDSRVRIAHVPEGDYLLHVWAEGDDPIMLSALTRKVQVDSGHSNLGVIMLPQHPRSPMSHENKFGQQYDTRDPSIY